MAFLALEMEAKQKLLAASQLDFIVYKTIVDIHTDTLANQDATRTALH
jgi:hypothetical protein